MQSFFGEELEQESDHASESQSDSDEEVGEQGILDDCELRSRILRATEQPGSEHANASSSLISPDSDPLYADITSKLSSGCPCSNNCLSQFTVAEVYSFCLSLREMTKAEKDMLILGKLHALSRAGSSIHHANKVQLGKRKRVTCDYHFDYRTVCKEAVIFLHDIGTKQLKNLHQDNGPIPCLVPHTHMIL